MGEAIESVLAQTLPRDQVELIVVDDGSTDGGAEVVSRFAPRVRYLRRENRGLSAARNVGIRASRAPFLAFLDADDRILPEKLALQLEVFAARPEIGLVYTGVRYIDATGKLLSQQGWSREEGAVLPRLVLGNLIHPHAALVRRGPVERAGGFDESLTSVEDWDLWIRLAQAGVRWACVDRPLAEYRIRPDAMHQNPARMAENSVRVLDRVFGDPMLPPAVARLRPLAYQRVYLTAACDHYRAGDPAEAARWLREAAAARPAFLTEPRSLRQFCRSLLPLERRSEAAMAEDWWSLIQTLRLALASLFAARDLELEIGRLRWRAELAYWRTAIRFARKNLWRRVKKAASSTVSAWRGSRSSSSARPAFSQSRSNDR